MRWTSLVLVAVACSSGEVGDDDTSPTDGTSLELTPSAVIDDDHTTIVHVTWSTPAPVSGWVEFGLDGTFDKVSPTVSASDHAHQLRGLKAGRSYSWRAVVQDGQELVTSEPQVVDVPPAPPELPTFDVVRLEPSADIADAFISIAGAASAEEGDENPESPFFVAFIDAEGDYVWYHMLPYGRGTSALDVSSDGQSVWWLEVDNFRQDLASSIVRMTLDGTMLSETSAYGGHHAAAELSDGRFAFLGRTFTPGDANTTLMTDTVEITIEGDITGATTIELFDTVDDWRDIDTFSSMGGGGDNIYGYQNVFDLTHSNSLAFVESENAVYPFVRLADTLLKIDVDSGALVWQMSGTQSDFTFPDGEPVYEGEQNSYLWSHGHYSQIWEGGLMMFDNGNNHTPSVSSIVEVNYDEENGTAEEVFRFTDPDGGFTNSLGDVSKLTSGHYVASWMTLFKLTEVTPDGEVVWRLDPERGHAIRRIRPVTDLYSMISLAVPPSGG